MTRSFRSLLIVLWLLATPLPVGAQSIQPSAGVQPPGVSPMAVNATPPAGYYDGTIQYSTIINCASIIWGNPYTEYGAGAFVGFQANPSASQPSPNQTYYIHVYVAGLGNSCSGMYFYVDVQLPPNTTLAITAGTPVRCFLGGAPISPASDCPQTPLASIDNPGAYALIANNPQHANLWPLPNGGTVEFQIPVKSSTVLTNATLQANIKMVDGNDNPWLRPQQGVYVFSSTPSIVYPQPSTTAIVATTAHSEAYLYTSSVGGTGWFDIGTTQSYGVSESVVIPGAGAWLVYDDWGPPALQPDTLYHWRFRFIPTSGSTVYGTDQTFRTLPNGVVSIGQGASAACTTTALNTALEDPTTREIRLDCGLTPAKITLTSSHNITSNLTITGASPVTLEFSGSGNFFNVQSGGHLTLNQITISKGNYSGCGGAVYIAAGGLLDVTKSTFDGNKSSGQGGAICNWGTLNITSTQFTNNSSTASHGGAIGNYGTMTITGSRFSGNSAFMNGGAIDMGGQVTLSSSIFDANTASRRGGAINSYVGTLNVSTSSITGNSAAWYGGGIASDASTTTITSSSISANTTPGPGGGIETNGAGSLTITNSTIAGNISNGTASGQGGGGLYRDPTSTGTVTILNSTFAANTSAVRGGNLYAGETATSKIILKNTLLTAGAPNNCVAAMTSQGNNLESAATCGLGAVGDLINQDPKLGLLQNNGGTTATHALLSGSPAIDAGTNTGCPAADQRGVSRPVDGSGDASAVCDIGAFEAPQQIIVVPPATTWRIYLPQLRR